MFFSRTDPRGLILFGNKVFTEISGYAEEEMLGAPHNIIRHPDMPKAVFKLFWDTIQAGNPIVAYVKNMAKTGDHYWVLAAAYPVKGGYLSIRIKPSSQLFTAVRSVYEQVLAKEQEEGVEAGSALLVELVSRAGFSNYEELMTKAMFTELRARDMAVAGGKFPEGGLAPVGGLFRDDNGTQAVIARIADTMLGASAVFRSVFDIIEEIEGASSVFRGRVADLLVRFEALDLLSLNLRVLAANLGDEGRAIGAISAQFQVLAKEIKAHLDSFQEKNTLAIRAMRECVFNLASMKMQTEMVGFFVQESIARINEGQAQVAQAFAELDKNAEIFSGLCRKSGEVARERIEGLVRSLKAIDEASGGIKKYINGLDVIEKMGAIEAGRFNEVRQAIKGHLQNLAGFNETLRSSMQDIARANKTLVDHLGYIETRLGDALAGLDQIFALADSLRK